MDRRRYAFGPFRVDAAERLLLQDGSRVTLTPKAFELLLLLVERPGSLLTRTDLVAALWPDTFVEEGNLTRCISVLRKALGDGAAGEYIETVPKLGYRFVSPVWDPDAAPVAGSGRPHVRGVAARPPAWLVKLATIAAGIALTLTLAYVLGRPAFEPTRPVASDRSPTVQLTPPTADAGTSSPSAAMVLPNPAASESDPGSLTAPPRQESAPAHRQLTFSGSEGSPAISPDGRRLAYVSLGAPIRRVMVQNLTGGPPVSVFEAPEVGALRWSPDGSEMMFWTRGGPVEGLMLIPRQGGRPLNIGPASAGTWSADGATMALARPLVGQLAFRSRRDGQTRVVSLSGVKRWIFDLDWSGPTNTLIFVTNDEEGQYTIWSIQPDGSRQTALVVDRNEIVSARWSPRGDAVYYTRRSGKTVSLYRIATDGRTAQPPVVVMTGLETDGSFSLAGDGSSLVYARAPYHSNLWVVDLADSSGTSRPSARPLTHGTAIIERPRVSPNGQDVLFNVGPEGESNLFTVPIAGGTPSQLTFLPGYNLGGAWSPNGAWVAFVSTQDGRPRVWRVSATGGRPEALSTGDVSDTYDLNWSPGPDILYQQSGNRNYYALDPSTGRERLLVSNPSVGWLFSPVYSPRTGRIAVSWSRNVGAGVWLLKPDGAADSLVFKDAAPGLLGWSTDEAWLYAAEGKRATYRGAGVPFGETMTAVRVFKVSLAGARQVVLSLPFDEVGGLALSPDARYLVCTVYSATSDVWRVDNFDSAPRDLADATPRRR